MLRYLYAILTTICLGTFWFIANPNTVNVSPTAPQVLQTQDLQEINIDPATLVNPQTAIQFVNNSVDVVRLIKVNIPLEQLTCLATNIYHESRGESLEGMIGVAHVTLNRVKSHRYPNQICDVVYQAVHSKWWLEHHNRLVPIRNMCQFTWYCDGKSDAVNANSSGWQMSVYVAMAVLVDKYDDPTYGATHYYNHNIVRPQWSFVMAKTTVIGNHTFHTF